MGEGLIPLPQRLVQRIVNLEFVEMAELLPEAWLYDEVTEPASRCCSNALKRRKTIITDILRWAQCFGALVSVLSTRYPDKVPEFMAYQATIIKCSREFEGLGWLQYDRAYRRQVAMTKEVNWSKVNTTLYNLCLAGKARRIHLCKWCLSDSHQSELCPEVARPHLIGVGQGFPYHQHSNAGRSQRGTVEICRLYNGREGNRCKFNPCKFAHLCMVCKRMHPVSACKAPEGRLAEHPAKRQRLQVE